MVNVNNTKVYQASAPGKVILCGEYSVLESWPAFVISVDRRVKLELHSTQTSGLTVETTGLNHPKSSLAWNEEGCLDVSRSSPLAMLADIINALLEEYGNPSSISGQAWHLTVDSSALFDKGDKLGLGSSAALTVALAGLFHQVMKKELPEKEKLWKSLQKIHSRAQGKRGSGVDIAASIAGATNCFVNIEDHKVDINPVSLPKDMHIRFIWTGTSASTPKLLRSLSQWKNQNGDAFALYMKSLGEVSKNICAAQSSKLFFEKMCDFTSVLHSFDAEAGIGIFANQHENLYRKSQTFNDVLYKPCGAGGGDLGIAISESKASLDKYVDSISCGPVRAINLNIDQYGVTTSESSDDE